jgi:O-succinylbenzoate synthase
LAPDVVAEWQHCQFARHAQELLRTQLAMSLSCSFADGNGKISGRERKIKAGACKGAGLGLKNFLAAMSGERIAR